MNDKTDAISASGARVTAKFDTATQRFLVTRNVRQDRLTVGENDTNFFSAVNITEGQVRGTGSDGTRSVANTNEIADIMAKIMENL